MPDSAPQSLAITDRGVIATFNSWPDFLAAMRLRAEELKIAVTSPDIAKVSGLPDALFAKILSPKSPRGITRMSMEPVLSLLGVRLAMIEDPITMQRYTSRLKKRTESFVHSSTVHLIFTHLELRRRQRKGGQNSRKYMTTREASAIARKAALARWARARGAS